MALNAVTLETLIDSKLAIADPSGYGVNAQRAAIKEKLIRAIAQAVVEHITTAGVVAVTAVTPGVGTAPGTIT